MIIFSSIRQLTLLPLQDRMVLDAMIWANSHHYSHIHFSRTRHPPIEILRELKKKHHHWIVKKMAFFFQKQIRVISASSCSPPKDAPSRRLGRRMLSRVDWGNDPSWTTDSLLWMTTNPARTAVTRTNPIVLNTTTVVNSFGCSAFTDLSLVLTKEEMEGSDEFLARCHWWEFYDHVQIGISQTWSVRLNAKLRVTANIYIIILTNTSCKCQDNFQAAHQIDLGVVFDSKSCTYFCVAGRWSYCTDFDISSNHGNSREPSHCLTQWCWKP